MSQTNTKTQINSSEKSSYWILLIIGLLFFLISAPIVLEIPNAIKVGDYQILISLIFPLAGLGMIFASWKMRQKFLFFWANSLNTFSKHWPNRWTSRRLCRAVSSMGETFTKHKPKLHSYLHHRQWKKRQYSQRHSLARLR